MSLEAIANYCEGCSRVSGQIMPYTVDVFICIGPGPEGTGTVTRRFCSLECLASWACRAPVILRCPGCEGTGWRSGFRSNGPCTLCGGEGSLPYPRVPTETDDEAREALRMRLASCGVTGKKLEDWIEREFQLSYRPSIGDTDHLEHERHEWGDPPPRPKCAQSDASGPARAKDEPSGRDRARPRRRPAGRKT